MSDVQIICSVLGGIVIGGVWLFLLFSGKLYGGGEDGVEHKKKPIAVRKSKDHIGEAIKGVEKLLYITFGALYALPKGYFRLLMSVGSLVIIISFFISSSENDYEILFGCTIGYYILARLFAWIYKGFKSDKNQ